MGSVRAAAVAGLFYPDDQRELASNIARYVAPAPANPRVPKAIIAPHAGYIYSGAIAGRAYATLKQATNQIKHVVLLGPAHRVAFSGLALPETEAFETPLGKVPIDQRAVAMLADMPQVSRRDDAHSEEHSLEVHLPFLQAVLSDFVVTPLVVGRTSAEEVTYVLDRLWGGDETLIVISSDLSHYENYDTARRMDNATADAIESLRADDINPAQACGRIPVAGLLATARHRNMRVERIGLCNSGDTAGTKDRVVGYGAWSFHEPAEANDRELLDKNHKEIFRVARASIRYGLAKGKPPVVDVKSFTPDLQPKRATFITLKKNKALRGCIGTVTAHRPFVQDIVENAYAAAFRDHRFPPLQEEEAITISLSLLGKPEPMQFADEAAFTTQLRPGIDGIILRDGDKSGLFLPQVWEDLPDPKAFLAHLKHKAGMAEDYWAQTLEAWRFTSTSTDTTKTEGL